MDKKSTMRKIAEKVGRDKAIDLVSQAYNTELISTMLSRLEQNKPRIAAANRRRDQLADALDRVMQVCDLTT